MPKEDKKANAEEVDEDFKFMLRLANTDIDGNRTVQYGLCSIKGVNFRVATIIAQKADVPMDIKMGYLEDAQVDALKKAIEELHETIPVWMMNRQMDYDSGDDMHLLGTDLELTVEEDITRLKKTRCYKGVRHETGRKVRGQRTSSNGRKGSTMGVVRKKK